ncbi:MAG: hypothetical protein ACJAXT_000298 [Paracoccaceae bacterium]|jgi:hypothetical protein
MSCQRGLTPTDRLHHFPHLLTARPIFAAQGRLNGNRTTAESRSVTVDTDAEPVVITLNDKDYGIQPMR